MEKGQIARGWTSEYIEARFHAPQAIENDVITFIPERAEGTVLTAHDVPVE
jgi:hypothetical protein